MCLGLCLATLTTVGPYGFKREREREDTIVLIEYTMILKNIENPIIYYVGRTLPAIQPKAKG